MFGARFAVVPTRIRRGFADLVSDCWGGNGQLLPASASPACRWFMRITIVRWLRVEINIAALRASLSREDRREYSVKDVCQWLRDAGFREAGRDWIVREPDLGHLQPDEVIAIDDVPAPDTE